MHAHLVFDRLHADRDGGIAARRAESEDMDGPHVAEELNRAEPGQKPQDQHVGPRAVEQQDGKDEKKVLGQGQNGGKPLGRERPGQKGKDPVGRELHQDQDQLHDDVVPVLEDPEQPLARRARQHHGQAEEDGEDNDLEHVSLGHGLNRIGREQVDDDISDGGRGLALEGCVRAQLKAGPGSDNDRGGQRQRNGDGGGRKVESHGLQPHPTQFADVVERSRAADQRDEDQRDHQQLQGGDEDRANHMKHTVHQNVADPPFRSDEIEAPTHQEAEHHADDYVAGEGVRPGSCHAFVDFPGGSMHQATPSNRIGRRFSAPLAGPAAH